MAAVAKSGKPSITTVQPCNAHRIGSGLIAGEDLDYMDAVCIKPADGLVYKAGGAAPVGVHIGFAAEKSRYAQGDSVTIYESVDVAYGSGLTPGTLYYLSATAAGGLDTTASGAPIGLSLDTQRIRLRAKWAN